MDRGESERLLCRTGDSSARGGKTFGARRREEEEEEDEEHGVMWGIPPRRVAFGLLAGSLLAIAAIVGAAVTTWQTRDPVEGINLKRAIPNKKMPDTAGEGNGDKELDQLLHRTQEAMSSVSPNVESSQSASVDTKDALLSSIIVEDKPNVIFILIDDVGMDDIGLQSTDLMELTPFIDSLFEGGVSLGKYYTNHFCTPARSSLMSGRDTFRTGMQYQEIDNASPWGLPLDEVTLAERFKAAGYSTHMMGKWNLGMYTEDHYPFNRGFDSFLGYLGSSEDYYKHSKCETEIYSTSDTQYMCYNDFGFGDEAGYINHDAKTTRWGPELEGVYSTSLTAERALQVASEHVARGTEDPLFMYLAFQAAHTPTEPPPSSLFTDAQKEILSRVISEDSTRMKFAKVIFFLDITLRNMVNELEAIGLMENTLLIIASDNGGCPSRGGSNYPFRGFKHTLFEGGVRVPAVVYSKSEAIIPLKARGTTYSKMMHVTDWTPTLGAIAGIPLEEMGKPLSGFDHWAAIIGERSVSETPIRSEIVLGRSSYQYSSSKDMMVLLDSPKGGFIKDGWKVITGERCATWYTFSGNNLPTDSFCDVVGCPTCTDNCGYYPGSNHSFLFNLEHDPFEEVNLAATMPDKYEEMKNLFNLATVDEVVPNYKPDDPKATQKWSEYNDWMVAWYK